jgi:hypothetical protein
MSDWKWFEDFEADARQRGDKLRARLRQIHWDAWGLRESDPDRTLLLFAEGRRLSQILGEVWWVLLFDHWRVHGTLYYKRDYRNVLDLAVRNALEVSKPKYTGFPQRLWIYNDLINIYLNLDPRGYAEEIEQSLTDAEAEVTPERDASRYLLLASRLAAAVTHDRLEDALEIALCTQAQAQADTNRWTAEHFLIDNYLSLCYLSNLRQEWADIAGWAAAGEALARQRGYQRALSVCLLWKATVAQRVGEKAKASRLYRTAASRMGRLKTPRCAGCYDAMCRYHELDGNLEESLRLRDQELEEFAHRGMVFSEFTIRLTRLRLLVRMGRVSEQDLAEARQATRKFRKPEDYLREIEQIEAGDSPT